MIDKKKIKEAAKKYAKEKESLCEKLADKYKSANSICSIVTINPDAAFKDGINWFLENLWHDASEEPKGDGEILVLCERKVSYSDTLSANYIKLHGWNNLAENRFITRWLYIEDLMKGGM